MRPLCGKKHGGNRKSQGALARLCEFPGRFRFTALKGRSRVATLHPGLYKWLREDARRVIGATAKPLYPIDGKAAGLDRRNPKTSLFEGGGPPAGGGRSSSPGLYTRLRESARRVIGATAKPLYPIDGQAAGLDRRNPLNPRQGLKQVHFVFLAWNYSFCAEPMI